MFILPEKGKKIGKLLSKCKLNDCFETHDTMHKKLLQV